MLTFKQHLNEEQELLIEASTNASTLFEGVLVDCWNLAGNYNMRKKWNSDNLDNNQKDFIKEIFKSGSNISEFLKKADKKPVWATTTILKDNKLSKDQKEAERAGLFWHLSRLCRRKIKGVSGNAKGVGATKLSLSGQWKAITGKTVDTSKADISIGSTGISVKAPSANIMSGKQLEGKATVVAALYAAGQTNELQENLMSYLNKFVTDANTVGEEMTGEAIKGAYDKEKEKTKLKGKDTEIQTKYKGVDVTQSESNLEIQKKLLIAGSDDFKKNCENEFQKAFKIGNVGTMFAYEAMSGREKFSGATIKENNTPGDTNGEATHMLIWDYDMKHLKFYAVSDKVSDVAGQLKMAATLKSSHRSAGGIKIGYSIYQSMRLAINTAMEDADKLVKQRNEQIEQAGNLLTEGMISEFSFKDMVGKAWNWFKDKVIALWNWLKEQWNKLKEKVKEMWEHGLDVTMAYFETDVVVKVNDKIRL